MIHITPCVFHITVSLQAKDHGKASKYQLRVEDVAHLTNIDETTNTYVNTTDLQRLVSSVRAKKKSENRLPTPPRIQYQTPKPYRPSLSAAPPRQEDNEGFRSDVVVVRAPMPLPNPAAGSLPSASGLASAVVEEEAVYSNLCEVTPPALPSAPPLAKVQAPKISPPPPPSKLKKRTSDDDSSSTGPVSPTAVARPAPPPPVVAKGQQAAGMASPPQAQKPSPPQAQKPTPPQAQKPTPPQAKKPTPPQAQKPSPPPVASKPNKGQASEAPASTAPPWKPTPPTLPKPSVLNKGRGLPPLKMALLPSVSRSSLDDPCNTPDTSIIELTPDSTPTTEGSAGKASISAKVAFLEGKLKTPAKPARAMAPRT